MTFTWPLLSSKRRAKLLRHAQQALRAQQMMMQEPGKSILHYTLHHHDQHIRMNHYPHGDRIDHTTGAQYFYHCHREDIEHDEHGHFHCFLRYPQIPKRIRPEKLPDWDKYIQNPMTHLIAIAMNRYGEPIRLFTVNRWVSSEIWYNAKHAPSILNRFKMTLTDDPYWQVLDQWVEAILHLFSPQIAWLHQQRDQIVNHHQQQSTPTSVYYNKDIEELSTLPIHLKTQIEWLLEEPT
jgi:hypothetical protein